MISERLLPKGPAAISKSAGQSDVIVSASQAETSGYDVYLKALGTGIDPLTDADKITLRLRVNGQPRYPFDAMTSQIGELSRPQDFDPPIYLGRNCLVEMFGEVDATATVTSKLGAVFHLLLKVPGT